MMVLATSRGRVRWTFRLYGEACTGRVGRWSLVPPLVFAGLLLAPATAASLVPDTPEQSWRVNGRVYATVVVGNSVFVGGHFSQAVSPTGATAPRSNLAAFRARHRRVAAVARGRWCRRPCSRQ